MGFERLSHAHTPALGSRARAAGPDGKFGNIHNDQPLVDGYDPDPSDDGFDDALDNIYSYEVRTW